MIQTLLLAYAGPGRTVVDVRADVPDARPDRPDHRRRPWWPAIGDDDFTLDPTRRAARRRGHDPAVTFLCSPNNPTGLVESPECSTQLLDASTGLVVVDEAYAEFSTGRRSIGSTTTAARAWCARSRRRGAWRRPGSVTSSVRRGSSRAGQGRACRTTSTRPSSSPGGWRCATSTTWSDRVSQTGRGARARRARRWPTSASRCSRRGANFVLVPPADHDAREVWQRLVDAAC